MLDNNGIHIHYLSQSQLQTALSSLANHDAEPLLLLVHGQQPSVLPRQPLIQLQSGLQSLDDRLYELWTANGTWEQAHVRLDAAMAMSFCSYQDYVIGSLTVHLASGGSLQQLSQQAYERIIDLIGQQNKPHLLRMWNYFPDINQIENGVEQYQSFCVGRHQAFERSGTKEHNYPAASAVGSHAETMVIIFIATDRTGLFLENPDQVSAYHYPRHYSPKSPSFARGAVYQAPGVNQLYISGTASIIGHESQFHGDISGQTSQTIKNMRRLIEHCNSKKEIAVHFDAQQKSTAIKVYLRSPDDLDVVAPIIRENFSHSDNICYLKADICRQELDIEIETLLSAKNP